MPFTPYHFGPSGFIGLVFRRWIDLPVFVLANVIVDVEVLVILIFQLDYPKHRYCHTLLVGAVVGALWGLSAYPLRGLFTKAMNRLRLPYRTSLLKMIVSGILGVWFHVLIDSLCHHDVLMFWPSRYRLFLDIQRHYGWYETVARVKIYCLLFVGPAILLYVFNVIGFSRGKSGSSGSKDSANSLKRQ